MPLTIYVRSSFGCICGGKCECTVWSSGRHYKVEVQNTEMVQAIWDKMVEQNPTIKEKNIVPNLQYQRELLEMDRRIISYDIVDSSELRCTMPPGSCCSSAMRKEPKDKAAAGEAETTNVEQSTEEDAAAV